MVKLNAFWTQWRKNMKRNGHLCTVWSGPGQANLVVIAYASSESSGEPAHPRSPAQSRQNLRCSLLQAMRQEEPSDRKPDPWPLWMAGHEQLKCFMAECSKTQIRLTRPNYACASVNNNNVLSEDLKMNKSLFYGEKCLFLLLLI